MAAQEAQLLLKVGLDLSTFRNQLATLGQAAAGYNLPIKIEFDRTVIKNELSNLKRFLGRQKFNIELNIVGGLTKDQFEKIQGRLDALSKTKAVEIPVSIRSAVTQKDVSGVVADINKTIKGSSALEGGGGKIRIGTSIKPSITQADVREFKKAVTESLSGISVNVKANVQGGKGGVPPGFPDLMEYMRTQGMVGKTASGMEMRMRNEPGGGQLERVLDTFARGVFRMLGMDPAVIRAQEAEKRRLPAINWEAMVPSARGVSTTSTMALAPGRAFPQLPGSAFTEQKRLVGDILNPALKEALRNAANAFVDAVRNGLNAAVRGVQVRDLGAAGRPMLGGGRVAGLLPAGVGRVASPYATGALGRDGETRAEMLARREREARVRSALREVDVMGGSAGRAPSPYSQSYRAARSLSAIVSYQAPGALVATGGGGGERSGGGGGAGGGGGGFRGFGGFGRAMGGIDLPGAGLIREIGEEFAFATKQVLLFGQAYQLLGFAQNFPAQVGQAVGELQSFRNTLKSISPTAQEAAASNEFILSTVEKYNVPLQSARNGFTKLYASMAPAGFDGGEIRDLFLGISKAAATFGMSSDKVDRVTYAFAQMASKGQVMSEELKGQLGDVLPGALGIFAKAAGFEGPQAIEKFSKALEDGAFKGDAMRALIKNVTIGLNREFGPGAEGAASTYQGVMTRMTNATKLFYETFEPVAVGFLNSVVLPITSGINTMTDGFNAFFSGAKAKTSGGAALAQELNKLRPAFEGIAANIKQIVPLLQTFGSIAISVGQTMLQIAGNPFVGYLARIYLTLLPIITTLKILNLQALIPLIGSFLRAIPAFVSFNAAMATGASTNKALQLSMQLTGQTAAITAGKIRLISAALATMGNIAIIAGIGVLIERFMMMKSAIDGVRQSTQQMLGSISSMANSGAVKDLENFGKDLRKQRDTFVQLQSLVAFKPGQRLTEEGAKKFEEVGMGAFVRKDIFGKPYIGDFVRASKIIEEKLQSLDKQSAKVTEKLPLAIKIAAAAAKQARAEQKEQQIDLSGGDGKAADRAAEDARKLADDRRKYEADLMKLNAQQAIELDSMYFEQWKTLQDKKFDYMDAGQNEWMKREIKFQRDLQAIELRRIEAVFRAQSASRKAEIDAESTAYAGGGTTGATGLLQGSTGISSGPHFDVRRADGSRISETEARALFDSAIRRQLQMTSGYGPRRAPTRGASTFHRGIDLAGPANTPLNLAPGYSLQGAGMQGGLGYTANVRGPQGQMYQVGHLQQPGGNLPASRVRKEAKQDYSANLAAQEAINAKQREALSILHANQQAQQEINILIREYVASIAPVEQQKLENSLLQDRINLIVGGLSGEALDTEIAISNARKQSALGIEQAKKAITEYEGKIEDVNQAVKDKKITTDEAAKSVQNHRNAIANNERKIKDLTVATQEYLPLLREQLHLAQQAAEAELRGSITRATPLGGTGLAGGFIGDAGAKFEEALSRGASKEEATRFAELQNQLTLLETRNAAIKSSVLAIGDAFGTAMTTGVASLVDGTASAEEVFANFLSGVGQALIQAAQQMIATYIAIGIARIFAGLGGAMGGAQTNLQGTGALSTGGVGGIAGGNLSGLPTSYGPSALGSMGGGGGFGQFVGGAFGFANGGVVTGPTLGLVGEGKYNEAIVPLPDGRSIPVQLQDGSIRDKMGSDMAGTAGSPMLSMSFQSTTINGVEYVDRAQLEAAMAETRRISVREGATRGATIALDKLANSPSSRRRVGLR